MRAAPPSREETGCIIPENKVAGTMVAIAVPKTAAIWVWVKAEISSPSPVVAETYRSAPRLKAEKLPLTGTPNKKIANPIMIRKLTIPTMT